jgi:di/tricarboxylate transporter
MSPQWITVIILGAAILLLTITKLRPDLIALMVMLALGITGVVDHTLIFSGFASSAVMTILGISMISVALQQTGAANAIGRLIYKLGGRSEIMLVFLVSLFSATLSLFMNNIAAVGVLLPAVMSLSRRSQTPPGRLLMPLAFGTILGGMATLLTTSNIIVSGALKDAGISSFGLLDFFPVGAPVVLVGILYLVFIGRKLLPKTAVSKGNTSPQALSEKLMAQYRLDGELSQLKVLAASSLAGKSISALDCQITNQLRIIRVLPYKGRPQVVTPEMVLHTADGLIVSGNVTETLLAELGLERVPTTKGVLPITDAANPLAEVLLSPHSQWVGKSLCEINFRIRYGLNVLAVWRQNNPIVENLSNLQLQTGDALLVQGGAEYIRQLEQEKDLVLLEEDPDSVIRPKKLGLAIFITLITLGFAAFDVLPVALVVLTGAVLLLLTGCMSLNDAFQRIEWKAIFLIAGMWPLTIAIRDTGLAAGVTASLLHWLGPVSPLIIAGFFLLISMLFTQFMSGPVAPIIIIPLALAAAKNFGIDPHPLALAVALGCSLAFITPLSHPVNIMVMNPGGYTFKDYAKVGLPLTVLSIATILAGLHFIWGL